MSLLTAIIRDTKSKGEIKSLRNKGMVPGIIYGGEEPNQKISVPIKEIKNPFLYTLYPQKMIIEINVKSSKFKLKQFRFYNFR